MNDTIICPHCKESLPIRTLLIDIKFGKDGTTKVHCCPECLRDLN